MTGSAADSTEESGVPTQPYSYLPENDLRWTSAVLSPDNPGPPTIDLGLDDEQVARVERLLGETVIVSLHDHPYRLPIDVGDTPEYMESGRVSGGFAGLAASGMTAVFDNLSGPLGRITSHKGWKWTDVVHELGMRIAEVEHDDRVIVARSIDDIERAHADGTVAIGFGLESATPIENELDRMDVLYGLGIRHMGLIYSESNGLGSGLAEVTDGGLTRFGRHVVERLNALGVVVDVSHASDRSCLDAFEVSRQPVLITHAGARSVWPTSRMKPDSVLLACAEQGGVLGVEAAPHSTISRDHSAHSLYSVMDHLLYAIDLMGIDHVGLGPDTMWGDHVGLHTVYGMSSRNEAGLPDHEPVEFVAGMDHPGENMRNVIGYLVKIDFTDEDIRKVIGGNAMRVMSEIWS